MNFSIKSSNKPPKPLPKPPQNQSTQKHFVTEFDPSSSLPDPNSKPQTIIAPISNNWRTSKSKPLDLPTKSDDPNLAFVNVKASLDPKPDPNMTYGLNIRQKNDNNSNNSNRNNYFGLDESNKSNKDDDRFSGRSGSAIDNLMVNKLRGDLESLPDHKGMEEFDEMSVDCFAAALLKGYGWEEGQGIGRNKKDVKVFEFKQQSGRNGLGFVDDLPVPPSNSKDAKIKKEKENVRDDDRTRSSNRNRNDVKNRKEKENVRDGDKTRNSKRSRERYDRDETRVGREKTWLCSRIRVRVISKGLKNGRLYLKKGEIVDVVGPTTCDVAMDESREIIQGVDQGCLETVLPRRGGPVLVLYGRHKGVYGSLQEKDMDRETAVVRNEDTHELFDVKLEQIAEYVGDPDDIGY